MRNFQETYLPWFILALAFAACGAVGYFAWSISDAEAARVSSEATALEEASKFEVDLRIRALARETREARNALESIARTEVISIVEAVEAVGDDAGVRFEILQVAAGTPIPAAAPEVPTIRPVNIVVTAQGTFPKLVHAATLLHALPLPSEVYQMQFERIPPEAGGSAGGSAGGWRFVVRVRVFTIAEISS